ncbi:RagB/SusD family nutrient uptake outer membrane protein [uncultured Bacteroides sp.]|uniref:RagB/SusD family nutrient uptake outer membrane protein n=1 Tax=uncultured Bacteroides sp. TaxID=162156 RepID=UPI002AA7BCF8|nr:RagB/SusD family nutrient uptake outer membrane protein [uncultured Bacteroides sp.]
MKKINIICLLSLVAFTSCDSILDKEPLDTFTNTNFWTNESNVSGYANEFYEQFTGYGNGSGSGDFYFKTLSDDQAGQSFADWPYLNIPASNATWKNGWIEIRRANIMLEKVADISDMNESVKNHWLGVAHLMRAWQYYHLIRMFGDVQWIEKSLDITDEGVLYGAREKRDDVMDKVLDDLNFAVANINDVTSKVTWSCSLANAMKAEICLYEGTFRKYRKAEDGQDAPDTEGANKFLTACKEACSAIMAKSYKLNDSYQGNYNSIDLSGNSEMIFYKAYKQTLLTHSLIDYTCSSTQLSGMSKDAFESYLFTDGKPLSLTSLNKNDAAPLQYGHLSLNDMLSIRDKRLAQTIDTVAFYQGNGFTRFNDGMEMTSSTGYGVAKYDNGSIPTMYRNQTSSNYTHAPLFWLAVIYLNYAEACAELGTITQSDLNNTINLLKDRAGLQHLSVTVGFHDPANKENVNDLVWEIRRERRCELMFDNWNRYWDLIRWHQLDRLDSSINPDILRGANVSNDPNCKADKTGNYIDGSKGKVRIYNKKYYLYPLPSDQISLNPQLAPNNPGWE